MSVSFTLLGILVMYLTINLTDYLAKRVIHARELKKGFQEHSSERDGLASILEDIIKMLGKHDVVRMLANAFRFEEKKPFTSVISAFNKRLNDYASALVGKNQFQKLVEGLPTEGRGTYIAEIFDIAISVCDASLSRLIMTHKGRYFFSGSNAICFLALCNRFEGKYSECVSSEDSYEYSTHDADTLSKSVESHINLVCTINVYSKIVVTSAMELLTEIVEKDERLGKHHNPIYDRIEAILCTIHELPSIELGNSQDEDVRKNARFQAETIRNWVTTLIDQVMLVYSSAVLAETSTEIERKLDCLRTGKTAFYRR